MLTAQLFVGRAQFWPGWRSVNLNKTVVAVSHCGDTSLQRGNGSCLELLGRWTESKQDNHVGKPVGSFKRSENWSKVAPPS